MQRSSARGVLEHWQLDLTWCKSYNQFMIGKPKSLPVPVGVSGLTGPIFDKELRVSSRRKRNYMLRSAYVALLGIFVVAVWLDPISTSGLTWATRMAEAGKRIVLMIVWFQFYTTSFLAVILLSTSINDEIYRRTLNTLMTTPITSFQIVMGKLLSKLFQIVLLLAISLPLLAIIRVFGGVPWGYLVSSLCITLTAVIFAGSVSLFFSIFCRRAYVVIIVTVLLLVALFGSLSALYETLDSWSRRGNPLLSRLMYPNPAVLLNYNSQEMLFPGMAGRVNVSLVGHCGIMLAASASILFVCMGLVRRVALTWAVAGPGVFERLWQALPRMSFKPRGPAKPTGKIRRVTGPPVMWKELISRRSSGEKIFVRTIIGTELVMVAVMYLFPLVAGAAGLTAAHAAYVTIFMGLGALSVTVLPATCITSEKETRAWPLLLTTAVSDWEILFGKFVGILRRSLPAWIILLVYLIPFWGIIAVDVLHMACLVTGTTVFLCGTGLYVSSRLRRTSAAVAANFVIAGLVWGILPALVTLFSYAFRPSYRRSLIELCWQTTPFVQAMQATWPDSGYGSPGSTVYLVGYIVLGLLFAWRAKCRFRRDIFQHVG